MIKDKTVLLGIQHQALKIGAEWEALAAVVEVESGGRFLMEGLCPMRIEGHYFYKRLKGADRAKAVRRKLASKRAGEVSNPRSMKARYNKLARMVEINAQAALESCSWGVGQVMGAHWKWLGYSSVTALVNECKSGVDGQISAMVRFIVKNNLVVKLQRHDWAGFARVYNGPGYKKNNYHKKMASAYRRYKKSSPVEAAPTRAVKEIQTLLIRWGFDVAIDGLEGPQTTAAIRKFQHDHGLVADGIAGPKTMAALRKNKPKTAPPAPKQKPKAAIGIAALIATGLAAWVSSQWETITNWIGF